MPLLLNREAVLDAVAQAHARGWVVPAFGVENLTTMEAVLAAAVERGSRIGRADLPIMLAVTNHYPPRGQTQYYTHSRQWQLGLRLFLAEAAALAAPGSPYAGLRLMLHLDHALHDLDRELFEWDMAQFSSIMFDASGLPLEENIAATRAFVAKEGKRIVIEGACDEVGKSKSPTSDPGVVERYVRETGVDWVVPSLGTEHRADASALRYENEAARAMSQRIGPRLVLHGTSSVAPEALGRLAGDGICKANVWTVLERDSAPVLLEAMARHAGKIAGRGRAEELVRSGLLGAAAEVGCGADLAFFPTAWRQQIVFEEIRRIASVYLQAWFPG